MKSLEEWLDDMFVQRALQSAVLSAPTKTAGIHLRKVEIRPIRVKRADLYQFTFLEGSKATHRNLDLAASIIELKSLLCEKFQQCEMQSAAHSVSLRIDRGGIPTISVRPTKRLPIDAVPKHDREKNRILSEGQPIDFLVRLGVMTQEGRVVAAKYDKFKQVNRFLEIAADVESKLKPEGTLKIIDFGTGKSYLTFAIYHYFTKVRGRAVSIVGLDLKTDVVEHCNTIAGDLGYINLKFTVGDIAGYSNSDPVDMVVSLHACDTATDDALAKAVSWGATLILAAPCCQHELFQQIRSDINRPILKHGILKERLSALVTDALRAQWLEVMGYSVQVMEFIETAHTPKNLLIRAVRTRQSGSKGKAAVEYAAFRDYWHVNPRIDSKAKTLIREILQGEDEIELSLPDVRY